MIPFSIQKKLGYSSNEKSKFHEITEHFTNAGLHI